MLIWIPVSYRSNEEIIRLVDYLKPKGYSVFPYVENAIKENRHIVNVVVKPKEKMIGILSITMLCFWSNGGEHRPLYADELIEVYERIVEQNDVAYYDELMKKTAADINRASGEFRISRKSKVSINFSDKDK